MNNPSAAKLSSKNLSILNDQLGAEALLVHKYAHAAQSVSDSAVRSQLYSISELHRKHYDTLLNYLNSHQ